MKFKIISIVVLVCVLSSTVLSGCSFGGIDNNKLLKPPKGTGEKAFIESIINARAGGRYTLKYPKDGEYRSAITIQDIDNDSKQEAIALYKTSGEIATTHILFMKEINGEWTDIGDFEGASDNIDKISFADINGDGKNEVVISWLSAMPLVNHMTLYNLGTNKVSELNVDKEFNDFEVMELTDEKQDSLLLMSLGTQETEASAALMQYNKDTKEMFVRSVIPMDTNVTQYSLIQKGHITDGIYGVFIDGVKNSNELVSQVIYWDSSINALKNPLYDKEGKDELEINPTFRIGTSYCQDVNDDKLVDIPTYSIFPLEKKEAVNMAVGAVDWNNYDVEKKELVSFERNVISSVDGYLFVVPKYWKDNITARQDVNTRALTFYEWYSLGNVSTKGNELLTIRVFTKSDWNAQKETKNFIEMESTTELVYAVKIPKDNQSILAIDLEQVKNNLRLLEVS